MNSRKGSADIPFVFSVHHASDNFAEFSNRCALTPLQRKAYSDYGTDKTVPSVGICAVIAELSRGIVDLNRNPDDAARFPLFDFANPPNKIWSENQHLNTKEQASVHTTYFAPYHAEIEHQAQSTSGTAFVVAWDNTAQKSIGQNEQGQDVVMPTIILSNNGDEESTERVDGQSTTCDPRLLLLIGDCFKKYLNKAGLPSDVHLNLVFKGKHVIQAHTTWPSGSTQSLQIEYSTALTHNQKTLDEIPGRTDMVRGVAELALSEAYEQYKLLQ
jgi:N-formylglutamate amidohydrolase